MALRFLGKSTLVGTSILAAYYGIADNQHKQDLKGLFKSSINACRASKILALSVWDYYYNLRGLEYVSPEYHEARSKIHYRVANRILSLSVSSRGIYFKAGQYLGSLERIMPREFTEVLHVLQDSAPPLSYDEIKIVMETDLPRYQDGFLSFEENAIAAASLAQVHVAHLKTGEKVAVKLQYPFLQSQTKSDFRVLRNITAVCNWLLKYYDYEGMDLLKLWKTFHDMCTKEIDFNYERENAEKTKKIFENDKRVYVPKIYRELSGKRILTMEFVSGVKINDTNGMTAAGFNLNKVSDILMNTFARMIFIEGHVHCDPHPGNLLIRAAQDGDPQLILLDHGFYRSMDKNFRVDFCKIWKAMLYFDYTEVKRICDKIGIGEYYKYLPLILTYRTIDSRKQIGEIISQEDKQKLHKSNDITFEKITRLMQVLPPDLLFIIRTSNLVALHNLKLGGTTRKRLLLYTDYSLKGLHKYRISYYWEKLKFWIWRNIFEYFFITH
ncbi:unnamed protein product [Blepharisma stoltei]|uniref:ABC1 atypical kinase-like domain-containing protein n=1 Tax=Blepharisma stoltei TaxID=1481888 RepID=A0AAU9IRY3_9CILI|nr:unnamed protein product [Blepharisma stoltei]